MRGMVALMVMAQWPMDIGAVAAAATADKAVMAAAAAVVAPVAEWPSKVPSVGRRPVVSISEVPAAVAVLEPVADLVERPERPVAVALVFL